MKVFVLGGTGAIGSRVVKALLSKGHDVRATARSEASRQRISAVGAEAIDVDVYDAQALQRAMRGCDAVVRLTTKVPKSVFAMRKKAAWSEMNRLRTIGSQRAVDAAIKAGAQVYITESFFAAYRSNGDSWVTEDCPSDAGGLDTMKAVIGTEHYAEQFARAAGRGIALRFGGFYSPDDDATRQIFHMLEKRMLPVIGSGTHYFPPLHLYDAAESVVHALSAPSGVYNVCDDNPVQWAGFLDALSRAIQAPRPMRVPAVLGSVLMGYPWRWMTRSVRMSNARFKSVTPWSPRYPDAVNALAR